MHDIKTQHVQSQSERIKELELQLELAKLKSDSTDAALSSKPKNNRAVWIAGTGVLVVVVLVLLGNSGSKMATPSSNGTTSTASTSSNNNLQALNDCIAEAQSEVNNNPLYQPIGGDAESYSLSQQEKANAMQPKITDCKTQYPTN